MVICKYFLQGNCRFGNQCRFEHEVTGNPGNVFNTAQNVVPSSSSGTQAEPLIKAVSTDILALQRGGQWVLSCYAPFKEKPNVPDLEDLSFEEVRCGFYEASRNGSIEQYKQYVKQLVDTATMRYNTLKIPNPAMVNFLVSLYNTPVNNGTTGRNVYDNSGQFLVANNSMFGNNLTQKTNNNNPTPMVQQQSIFAQNQQNAFRMQQQPQQQSIFAQNQANAFGGQQQSIFAQASSSQQNSNPLFGNNLPSTNIFLQGNQPMFVQQQPQQQPPPYGAITSQQQNLPNLFGGQMSVTNVPQPQSIFGNPAEATTLPFQNNNPVPQSSIFGNANQASFQQNVDMSVYSKIEDLTPEERAWFESDSMDMSSIPEKPPTYDMCFK